MAGIDIWVQLAESSELVVGANFLTISFCQAPRQKPMAE
jgi:hypothetical protein